jgi:parallel beta-helix repeat protein
VEAVLDVAGISARLKIKDFLPVLLHRMQTQDLTAKRFLYKMGSILKRIPRKIFLVIVCVFLATSVANANRFSPSILGASFVSQTSVIHVPGNYSTIQAAVNAASPGDTISVASGVYYENVIVNKSLKILGENNTDTIVRGVLANFTFRSTIEVRADSVEISGLTVRNGYSGIYLNGSKYCNIHGNILTATAQGGGISLSHSSDNTIANNTAIDNGVPGDLGGSVGINVEYSNSNLISGNLITKISLAQLAY